MAWRLCCESGLAHRLGKLVYGRERLTKTKEHHKGADYAMSAHMNSRTFVIVCRGTIGITDNPNDWLNNLGALLVPLASGKASNIAKSVFNAVAHRKTPLVHSGFYDSVKNISSGVINELISFRNQVPNGKVFITGHSKGGAMAQIFAELVAQHGFTKEQIEVITFGAPKVGNKAFGQYITEKAQIKNIVNKHDSIAGLAVFNYKPITECVKQIPSALVHKAKEEGFTQWGGLVAAHFMAYTLNYYPSEESREALRRLNPNAFHAVYEVFLNS